MLSLAAPLPLATLVRAWLVETDQRAADEVFRRLQPTVRRAVAHFPALRHEAEDLAQEIAIRAFAQLGRLDAERPLDPWIGTLARRHCLTRLKSAAWRRTSSKTAALADWLPDPQPAPDAVVLARERASAVQAGLARLPPADRQLLEHAPGTARSGPRPGAVKVRAHRARRRLRQLLVRWESTAGQ